MFSLNSKYNLQLANHGVLVDTVHNSFLLMTFVVMLAVSQVALDWISGNWYFLDDNKELIFLCNSTLTICTAVVEVNLNKPRALALDPPNGYDIFI